MCPTLSISVAERWRLETELDGVVSISILASVFEMPPSASKGQTSVTASVPLNLADQAV